MVPSNAMPPTATIIDHAEFSPGGSHVLPYWFKRGAEVPDRITLLVEREDRQEAVYAIVDLNKMLDQKYDAPEWTGLKGLSLRG
jgi:hypothetical protein